MKFSVKVIYLFSIIFLGMSCSEKNGTVLAIDVLLVPSESVIDLALDLNGKMVTNNPKSIKLDDGHIPHVTLLQCYVKESNLPAIKDLLKTKFTEFNAGILQAESLLYNKDTEESFAMIRIKRTEALQALHEKTIKLLEPYMLQSGSEKAFIQNPDGSPIGQSTLDYVPKFVSDYSFEKYDAHISLGTAQTKLLDSLSEKFTPIEFYASKLAVYQLGDSGTAQKLIWENFF